MTMPHEIKLQLIDDILNDRPVMANWHISEGGDPGDNEITLFGVATLGRKDGGKLHDNSVTHNTFVSKAVEQ